jgi:hypothetical protein
LDVALVLGFFSIKLCCAKISEKLEIAYIPPTIVMYAVAFLEI